MATQKFKQLPYGNSDFGSIRTGNYAYVDKTQYIEMLEDESNKSQFFIRPRKFGKSLFFSMLSYYYDINQADKFEELFGDLYIGKHPTPEKNKYAMLEFDFSGIETSSEERFMVSFSEKIRKAVRYFFRAYSNLFSEADLFVKQIDAEKQGIDVLEKVFYAAKLDKVKLFVIIDEYDQFANDLIAMGSGAGKKFYKNMIKANGLVRDFYENLKIATKSSIVNRTFITGISPVMLDDLTSGYNIATILTLDRSYNEMMGFTQEEVNDLMKITGVDPKLITINMEQYYNGYLFHEDGEHKVYNPSMILYFFSRILKREPLKNIIDPNQRTDYGRIENLIKNKKNRDILINIIKEGGIA
ncbi:MAG: AAA family ATPase, partial [Prevotellaceae bacterium]|nr:AAA family ATPase [Prevotellaceae bacterium]